MDNQHPPREAETGRLNAAGVFSSKGFRLKKKWLLLLLASVLLSLAVPFAWGGLALAQEALEAMVSYSRKRKQFGQKVHTFQLVQGMLGDAVTKIHAARALCVRAGELRKKGDANAVMESTIAKYFTSKIAAEITAAPTRTWVGYCANLPVSGK